MDFLKEKTVSIIPRKDKKNGFCFVFACSQFPCCFRIFSENFGLANAKLKAEYVLK